MPGQHVRVGVGGDAGDDPDQDVLGPAGRHDRLQPVDVIGSVDNHQADAVLDRHGDLFGAFRVAVQHDQRRVDPGLERGEDLPAAGHVQPEALLRPSPAGPRCRERPWTRTPLANSASARPARSGTRGPGRAARPRRPPAPACRTRRRGRRPGNRRWSASRRRPWRCRAGTGPAAAQRASGPAVRSGPLRPPPILPPLPRPPLPRPPRRPRRPGRRPPAPASTGRS